MQLNLRDKLFGGFGAMLILFLVVAFVGWRSTVTFSSEVQDLYDNNLQAAVQLATAQDALWQLRYGFPQFMVLGAEDRAKIVADEPKLYKVVEDNVAAYGAGRRTAEEKQTLKEWNDAFTLYKGARPKWFELYGAGKIDEAAAWRAQTTTPYGASSVQAMGRLIELQRKVAAEKEVSTLAAANTATLIVLALVIVTFVAAVGLSFSITRNITVPLGKATRMIERISKGELGTPLRMNRKDEIGVMANATDQMVAFLQEVVADIVKISGKLATGDLTATPEAEYRGEFGKIKDTLVAALDGLNGTIHQTNLVVTQVAQSVDQVRSVSETLAANSQEQASAVEEVSSNLERTDGQVKNSAESAGTANQLVIQTATLADVGQQKMKALTEAMGAIAQSSQEIAKIIKAIDEIAFQTNLLALNAAVEAAREGQAGRGFAVVAQEVRNLAERSAKAAKSTAELIDQAGRRTQEGVKVTGETGSALGEIVQNVVKVKDLMGEIAAASEEKSKSLAQINGAMAQVNQGTQSSSVQSEELASTADELGGLADRLQHEVARFQLRAQAMGETRLDSITPEMLQALIANLQQQNVVKAASVVVKGKGDEGDGHGITQLNRDERGYGKF